MVKPFLKINAKGFSIVELMVALLFTMFLMAGLASVFKASLSTFYTSGETLSSVRRNRMSIYLLREDINAAGMYLTDIATLPQTLGANPPFYIIPNVPIAPPGGEGDPKTTDELYFYMDEPLPFEGKLISIPSQQTAAELVMSGGALNLSLNNTYTVSCPNSDFAKQVADQAERKDEGGLVAVFKDSWEALYIISADVSGRIVTIITGAAPNSDITGNGSSGFPSRTKHIDKASVVFVKPAQMVRYRIEMLPLNPDPNKPDIPCLVRDQGHYKLTAAGFTAAEGQRQIITENISGFKVYLSVNGGKEWAGLGFSGTGFASGWNANSGIRGLIDAQLAGAGRANFKTTRGSEHWFRSIPTLVRVDLTTRTATKRVEFSEFSADYDPDNPTAGHRIFTQTLIFVPRHFGLPLT